MTTMAGYMEDSMAVHYGGLPTQSPLKQHGQDACFAPEYIFPPNDHLTPQDDGRYYHLSHSHHGYMDHGSYHWRSVPQMVTYHPPYHEIGPPRSWTLDSTDVSSADSISARPSEEPRLDPAYSKFHQISSPYTQVYASPSPTHASLGADCTGVTPQEIQQLPDAILDPTDHLDIGDRIELQQASGAVYVSTPSATETGLPTPAPEAVPGPVGIDTDQPMEEVTDTDDNSGEYSPNTRRSKAKKQKSSPKTSAPKSTLRSRHSKHRVSKSTSKANALLSPTPSTKELSSTKCPTCKQDQSSKNALARHVQTAHSRPFTCIFDIYGCTATFGAKNEWKRHCSTQHLRLSFYRCDVGACMPPNAAPTQQLPGWDMPVASPSSPGFNDFNRKDLFIQHHRRMHAPDTHSDANPQEKERFKAICERAARRCQVSARKPPPRTICGFCQAKGSPVVFEGPSAWETRMEHVGRHLESAKGEVMQWDEDIDLRNWLVGEGLLQRIDRGQWRLTDLIRAEEAKPGRQR